VVEFAIVLPVLMLIIFGIIDFGTTYNDYQGLRSGVRDGTRDAVTANYGSNNTCNLQGVAASSASPADEIICHVKDRAGLGYAVRVGVWVGSGGWVKGATLRICAQFAASSTTGFTGPFLNGKVMTARVDMRIEQNLPAGQTLADTKETSLSTPDWPASCLTGS
jgi:hypothetical protein